MPSGVLSEDYPAPVADHLRSHYPGLECVTSLYNTMAVYAALVGERVVPDDRRVYRYPCLCEALHKPRSLNEVLCSYRGLRSVYRVEAHDGLCEVRIAGSLSQAVDCDLNLPGTGLHSSQAVRHRKPEVVVTVHIHEYVHVAADLFHEPVEGGWRHDAHSVWYVYYVRPSALNSREDLPEEGRRRPCGIHGREEAQNTMVLHVLDCLYRVRNYLLPALLYRMRYLYVGGRYEYMDHADIGIETPVDIVFDYPGEAADRGCKPLIRYGPDRFKLALGRYRKASLDDIDPELVELPGDYELLLRGERYSRRLLSVPQGRVEYPHLLAAKVLKMVESDPTQKFLLTCMQG